MNVASFFGTKDSSSKILTPNEIIKKVKRTALMKLQSWQTIYLS